jgi:hypothetical protein
MYNPIPKPKHKKQKRAVNNSRPTAEDICEVCGKPYAHNHEVFFGKNRQNSIKYGMQKRLCYEHHNKPGCVNPHYNKAVDALYKREAQVNFQMIHGNREDFVSIFGKSYLEG